MHKCLAFGNRIAQRKFISNAKRALQVKQLPDDVARREMGCILVHHVSNVVLAFKIKRLYNWPWF